MAAPDVKRLVDDIICNLNLIHIRAEYVYCYRSKYSKSKHTIARIHGLSRIWQEALGLSTAYIIEVISERYDVLNDKDKEKILIHELLHIPKGFSGGFRQHKGYVDRRQVERLYDVLLKKRALNSIS